MKFIISIYHKYIKQISNWYPNYMKNNDYMMKWDKNCYNNYYIFLGLWLLMNLTELWLNNNSLTTLPSEIWNLTKLTWLYLSNNSSLWNLSYNFSKNTSNRSQINIPTIWKTMTIWWNGTKIVITITP